MANQKNQNKDSDLPSGLAQPAVRALHGGGYTQLKQLTKITEADLLKLHGMGPKAICTLRTALQARGLDFADPRTGAKKQPKQKK